MDDSKRTPSQICEDLQLLRLFSIENYYACLPARPSDEALKYHSFQRADLRNLVVISSCLAGSGDTSDAVSVGLNRDPAGLEVVLALDRPVTRTDEANGQRLCDVLSKALQLDDAAGMRAVQAVATELSRPAISRLVRKALAFMALCPFDTVLEKYGGDRDSSESELKEGYAYCRGGFGECSLRETVSGLVKDVNAQAAKWLEASCAKDAPAASLQRVILGLEAMGMLRLFGDLMEGQPRRHPIRRLYRTICKLSFYGSAIPVLLQTYRRLVTSGGGAIRFRWLPTPSRTHLELSTSAWDVVLSRNRTENFRVVDRLDGELQSLHPAVTSSWIPSIDAITHAEIRLVIHLERLSPSRGSKVYLGRSKRSCYACSAWIDRFNYIEGTRWRIWRGHGQDDPTWLVPEASKPRNLAVLDIAARLRLGFLHMGGGRRDIELEELEEWEWDFQQPGTRPRMVADW